MKLTVIICTNNRGKSLFRALNSVAQSILPQSTPWEVLVVDNNSTDRTADIARDFCKRYPERFRYLYEPQQGKSYALNSGIREARGEILAFMDDDVVVGPEWLRNLTLPLSSDEFAGSGGRILPQGELPFPNWFPQGDKCALASIPLLDLGAEAGELHEPPFGTNMAYKRKMFEKYGLFRTDLGPLTTSGIQGEDSEFGRRLLNAGERLLYLPSAAVYHKVHKTRITQEYLLSWYFAKGRSAFVEFGAPSNETWCFGGISLFVLARLFLGAMRWFVKLNPSERIYCKTQVWHLAGMIYQSRIQFKTAKHKRKATSEV